jgi:hypothetical protein
MKDGSQCPIMPGTCIPGCFCPDGSVRNGDKCVKPNECRDCEYSAQRTVSLCSIIIIPTSESVKAVMKQSYYSVLKGADRGVLLSGLFTAEYKYSEQNTKLWKRNLFLSSGDMVR